MNHNTLFWKIFKKLYKQLKIRLECITFFVSLSSRKSFRIRLFGHLDIHIEFNIYGVLTAYNVEVEHQIINTLGTHCTRGAEETLRLAGHDVR